MRILMLCERYPPLIGGLERHVQSLAHALSARGHEVTVATLGGDSLPPQHDEGNVTVYRLPGWSRALAPLYRGHVAVYCPPLPDPGLESALRRVIAKVKPEIVHAHGWEVYSYARLKRLSNAKLVVTLHDYGLVCPTKTYLRAGQVCTGPGAAKCLRCARAQYGTTKSAMVITGLALSGRLNRHVDRFIAISTAVRQASLPAASKAGTAVDVVPTFVPDSLFEVNLHAERPAFLPEGDDYIQFVGRHGANTHKGFDVLLDAYGGLSAPPPLVALVATGQDDVPAMPPGVWVARNVAHPQVMASWAHCAIGVVPSVWPEPFGQVAIEAMACGKPVIASAVGGLGDVVVHGETGLLVPPGDADALRLALRTLLADPALRRRMGAAGRERAKRYVVSAVVGRIERIYAELLGTGPTTAPAAPSASRRPAFVVIPRSHNEQSTGSS